MRINYTRLFLDRSAKKHAALKTLSLAVSIAGVVIISFFLGYKNSLGLLLVGAVLSAVFGAMLDKLKTIRLFWIIVLNLMLIGCCLYLYYNYSRLDLIFQISYMDSTQPVKNVRVVLPEDKVTSSPTDTNGICIIIGRRVKSEDFMEYRIVDPADSDSVLRIGMHYFRQEDVLRSRQVIQLEIPRRAMTVNTPLEQVDTLPVPDIIPSPGDDENFKIYGIVTQKGNIAANAKVIIEVKIGKNYDVIDSTRTSSFGEYEFYIRRGRLRNSKCKFIIVYGDGSTKVSEQYFSDYYIKKSGIKFDLY